MIRNKSQYLIGACFFVLLLPFVGRPYFFDDGVMIANAVASAKNFCDPYNFEMDLGGPPEVAWPKGQAPIHTHAPLMGWFMGLVVKLLGPNPIPLHSAVFGLSAMVLLAVFSLARRFVAFPRTAMLLFATSPVFLLTAPTFYPHILYTGIYGFTLVACMKYVESAQLRWALIMGLLASLAALTLHQWPLIFLVCGAWMVGFSKSKIDWHALFFSALLFLLVSGSWAAWEHHLYGAPQFVAAFRVRVTTAHAYRWAASFLPSVYLSAALPIVVMGWMFLIKESKIVSATMMLLTGLGVLFFHSDWGGFDWMASWFLAFGCVTGIAFLTSLIFLAVKGLLQDRFIVGWLFLEFLFIQVFEVLPAGHHVLIVMLPTVLALSRMFEIYKVPVATQRVMLLAQLALSLTLVQADWSQAEIGKVLARDHKPPLPGASFYWGNSFGPYEYHLKQVGWLPYDRTRGLKSGEFILLPKNMNAHAPTSFLRERPLIFQERVVFRQRNPFRTFSIGAAAGWYSASWGALPYAVGSNPVEEFLILKKT